MKKLHLFLLSSLFGFSALAAVPIVFKLTDRSVQLINVESDKNPKNLTEKLENRNDPKLLTAEIVDKYFSLISMEKKKEIGSGAFSQVFEINQEQYEKNYSSKITEYIEAIASSQNAKVHRDGSTKIFSIEDGAAFFRDLYAFNGVKDPMLKAMILVLLGPSSERQTKSVGSLEKMVSKIFNQKIAHTFLLSADKFSEADLNIISKIAKNKNYQFEKNGNIWILGSGFSFYLTRDIIQNGRTLSDPISKERFEKIIRYHVNFHVSVTQEYLQGAAAYFLSRENKMTFVLPSRGNLNSYTHEMTHSRFNKFTKTLSSWTANKGYKIPYQIGGPGRNVRFTGSEGFFNLLNEINSWRIGEHFDGKGGDQEILETLTAKYGEQAGYEATELLEKVWSPEKLAGKSVPYLIYSEIRDFNKMTNDQLVTMGLEGVAESDLVKKMNFLIMYKTYRFRGTSSEGDADSVLGKIAKNSNESPVLKELASMNLRFQKLEPAKRNLSDGNFEEVFDEFIKIGSEDSVKLLIEKFVTKIRPQHIDSIVKKILQGDVAGPAKNTIQILKAVFEHAMITKPIMVEKNETKVRATKASPFLEALDASLSARLYDGGIATKKMSMLNFISAQVLPEELPRTYEKTLDIYKNMKSKPASDFWLARLFFMPSEVDAGKAVLWGEKLIHDLKDVETVPEIKEGMGFFYKEAHRKFVSPGSSYGQYSFSSLGEKTKVDSIREMSQLSSRQKESLQTASRQLWILAGDENPKVRTAALYAMLSSPMYLIENERRLQQAVLTKETRYAAAVSFLLEVAPDMAPQAKRIFDIQNQMRIRPALSCNQIHMRP